MYSCAVADLLSLSQSWDISYRDELFRNDTIYYHRGSVQTSGRRHDDNFRRRQGFRAAGHTFPDTLLRLPVRRPRVEDVRVGIPLRAERLLPCRYVPPGPGIEQREEILEMSIGIAALAHD